MVNVICMVCFSITKKVISKDFLAFGCMLVNKKCNILMVKLINKKELKNKYNSET